MTDEPTPGATPPPNPAPEPTAPVEPPPAAPAPPPAAAVPPPAAPEQPAPPQPYPQQGYPQQGFPPQTAPAPAPKKGSRKGSIIVLAVLGVIIAITLFVTRNNAEVDDLKVGDCFQIPNGTTVTTVEKQPCTESHNGEIIFIAEYDGATYPISLTLDNYVEDHCVPAFESYVGRSIDSDPPLSIGYFHPTQEGWNKGDRTVTCYVSQPDESPMTESLKSS